MTDEERFQALLHQGLAASRDNRRDAALDLYARASADFPMSGIPHFLIGSEHASSGDIDAAEAAFAHAVLLAPHFPLARYQLGLLQFSSQRAALAQVTWAPLLSLGPAESLGHFVRGFAALAQGHFVDCTQHFEAGLACDDANPAVAADAAQVLAAVRDLAATAQGEPAVEPTANHVLLVAYGRGFH